MTSVTISGVCEKHITAMAREYAMSVLNAAAEKYGFSAEEAAVELLSTKTEMVRPKKKSSGPKKSGVEKNPQTILPFCGDIRVECCKGIRLNHQLFTQCSNSPTEDDFCKTCNGQAAKNAGKPTYGTIEDRMAVGRMEYCAGGKKVVRYSRVMDKLNITREEAEKAAATIGVVIAEDQFEHEVVKKGRPAKSTEVSDTESESSSTSSQQGKKKAGRPKKIAKVVQSSTGDDLISSLVAEAAQTEPAAAEEAKSEEVKPPTKTAITKAGLPLLKDMCASAGLKEAKKAEMQKNLRLHYGYDSDEEKKPAAAPTQEPTQAPTQEPTQAPTQEPTQDPTPAATTEACAMSEDDRMKACKAQLGVTPAAESEELEAEDVADEDDDGVEVEMWSHPKTGKTYLIDKSDNMLYDAVSQNPVGIWNHETENIDEIDEEDEDED